MTISKNTKLFDAACAKSPKIPFNPEWANHTGYYNYAVAGEHAPVLNPGEMVTSNSGEVNNRNILIIGTRFGNVVLFQRYTGGASGVITGNIPRKITDLFIGTQITSNIAEDPTLLDVLIGIVDMGEISPNIGTRIERLFA